MKRWLWLIIVLIIVAGSTILCVSRWQVWFGNPAEPEWTEAEISHQFITFDNDSVWHQLQCDTLSFLLFGDIHNSLSNKQLQDVYIRHNDVDFMAQLGDWMERPYHYYEQKLYKSIIGTGLDSLPVMALPGNHEYLKGVIKKLPPRWKHMFANPKNGPNRYLGTSYFVDFPAARIITIDTDGLFRMSDYTQVAFWLKKTLREARDKFTIVMMHHPVYSTAKGRQNILIWMAFHGVLREADVVFSGHDHNYARRTVYYKARFWKKEQPTIFIATNSSNKSYSIKSNVKYDASFSGEPVYEYITIDSTNLHIQTVGVNTAYLIDELNLSR